MADVLIVGGGVMGCGLAWKLASQGAHVRVLDRGAPGAEASSAAAGILAPRVESAADPVSRELGLASLARYPKWAEALREATGIDIGFRQCGLLHVAFDQAGVDHHDGVSQALRGHPLERLDHDALLRQHTWLGSSARDGLWLSHEAVVDNQQLTRALQEACKREGVVFEHGCHVRSLRLKDNAVRGVVADEGLLEADQVVICAGAWTSLLPPPLETLQIHPVRGQMLVLRTQPGALPFIVFGAGKGYLVPRDDGRVLVGSTMEHAGFDKAVTPSGLAHLTSLIASVFPALSEAQVMSHWAGLRPASPDGLPVTGPLGPDGLWVASGHLRNGILLAPVTADIVAAQMQGEPPAVDPSPFLPERLLAPQ